MAKGPGRSLAKEKLWRERLARQESLGITIREFCRREGLSEPSMYGWRRELARRAAERSSQASERRGSHGSAGPLLPIRVMDGIGGAAEPLSSPIEVVLPSNLRILVRPGFDAELLRQVTEALANSPAALPC